MDLYIGIDECYGVPGKGKYEVHVAISEKDPSDHESQRNGFYPKTRRANHTIDEILMELEGRLMAFTILKRNKHKPVQVKEKIYPELIKKLLEYCNTDCPVHLLIDGQAENQNLISILKREFPNLNISFVPKGDTKYRLLNLADLLAYTISLHSRGVYCGPFERYKVKI